MLLVSSCNLFRYGIEERKKEKNASLDLKDDNKNERLKKAEIVIKYAKQYEGTPYLLGGETKKGIDCSALVMLSYKNIGIMLPRTSFEQSNYGKTVQLENALPGDLIFFKFKKSKSTNPVNHVGIVSKVNKAGEVYFFHASTSLGVTESSLAEPYYKEVFVKVTRVY
ncbi:MAG TPA: C40 family peptidase [Bacteroidia bacterium]|nr:C40 family peptidase [Bacteroidia bacterium]